MKKLLYGAPFLIFWIIINHATTLAQQSIGPRMVIEKKLFDAKQVKEGEIIKHTFTALNKGDRALEIYNVSPG